MATWPPVPQHYREAAAGTLEPPPLPPADASYVCFGERFPRESRQPTAGLSSGVDGESLRELHGTFGTAYLELLACMTATPSAVYDLQLKVQSLEEIVTHMQQLLADDCRHWEAGEELVRALRAQAVRKVECALALDAACDTAEHALGRLLEGTPTAAGECAARVAPATGATPDAAEEGARVDAALNAVRTAVRAALQR
jgi:hypothetical protein